MIRNETDTPKQVTVRAALPAGWSQKPEATVYKLAPHDAYPIQLTVVPQESDRNTWKTLHWEAESDGQRIGSVSLRVDVVGNGLPQ